MKPYLLALCGVENSFDTSDPLIGKGRGVAVAVASLSGNRSVFATCRHNIINKVALSVYDEDHVALVTESKSMTLLVPQRNDLDLVLFVLPIAVPPERIRLSGQVIEDDTILSHAQNIISPHPESKGDVFAFSEATTRKSEGRVIRSLGSGTYDDVVSDDAVRYAKEAGRQTFYNLLKMESRPGVSGSPLWDKYGAIRGIVCGGTRSNTSEPMLVYLPVRYILSELKTLLKNLRGNK